MQNYDDRTAAHLQDLFGPDQREHAFRGRSPEDHTAWAAATRPLLHQQLGLTRMREELAGFEPSVSLGEPEDLGGYTRRKCVLHSEPHFDVPFWYLEPKDGGPHPLGLFPHGHARQNGLDTAVGIAHSPEMREKIDHEERDVAVQAVQRGYAAIAPATRGFAPACIPDINERHDGRDCRSHAFHALLAGRTAIAERVWDMQRLIDWGATRPGVDTANVLVMGNSGGGVVTLYTAACDERVNVAVASCSFAPYVSEIGCIHHCDCNVVPGILRFGEFHDVAGLIAPRHLLAVHGREDALFPLSEVDRAVADLRAIYDTADAADAFEQAYGPGGHRFYKDLMWPFIDRAIERAGTSRDEAASGRR